MCEERLALLDRYNSLVMEHAQRASEFGELVEQERNHDHSGRLQKALLEIDLSRQSVREAREQLRQHTIDHRCDHLTDLLD